MQINDAKNYIFDLYGTLIDIVTDENIPELWKAIADYYACYGADYDSVDLQMRYVEMVHEEERILTERTGYGFPEIDLARVFARLLIEAEHHHSVRTPVAVMSVDELVHSQWIADLSNMFRVLSRERMEVYPGVIETLEALRENGKRIYLLSNAQALFTIPEIEQCGLMKYFDGVYLSSEKEMKKPQRSFMELLLEENGLIKLDKDAGIQATVKDIKKNPYNIEFKEVEAAQVPNVLKDVNFAVINSNYALDAKLNPTKDALAIEGSSSAYSNILAVKEGNENTDLTKALKAALESKQVADYIAKQYDGAVVSTVDNPTDGYDSSVDYAKLAGQKITVAASPTPHAEILAVAKDILAKKDITLEVTEFTDYVQPNKVVDSGEIYANYFQHKPYLDDFNKENGTKVVSVASIHVEPMGIYGGKSKSLDELKK